MAPCDIVAVVRDVCDRFGKSCEIQGIECYFTSDADSCVINSDREALTKVISNVLANAVKFTRDRIAVALTTRAPTITLTVTDNGSGIDGEDAEKIFLPFYQVSDGRPADNRRTGLGLSLSASLMQLLSGRITLDREYTAGARFVVQFPAVPVPGQVEPYEPCSTDSALPETEWETGEIPAPPATDESLPAILVAEDNRELQQYIGKVIGRRYHIWTADDGQQALQILAGNRIDLIVSDILMPVMNGFELCRRVRENVKTSHIPIIILTANIQQETRLRSLECGADAYIEKPFAIDVLMAQINNVFANREKLRQLYINSPLEPFKSITRNETEDAFLEKLNRVIETNLDNPNLYIEDLANTLGISRSYLFVKIKAISGMTPNDYLTLVRLKKAAALLASKRYRVNEVSYLVGFSSPSYFSRCFQKQFGMLPSEFLKKA